MSAGAIPSFDDFSKSIPDFDEFSGGASAPRAKIGPGRSKGFMARGSSETQERRSQAIRGLISSVPGVDQTFQGVHGRGQDAAADVLEGVGKTAATVFGAPAAIAAPIPTAVGMVAGGVAGAGTQAATGSRLAGDVVGAGVGAAAGAGAEALTSGLPSIWSLRTLMSTSEGRQAAYNMLPSAIKAVVPNPSHVGAVLDAIDSARGVSSGWPRSSTILSPPTLTPKWNEAGVPTEAPLKPGPSPTIAPKWNEAGMPVESQPKPMSAPSITPRWNEAGEPTPKYDTHPIQPRWSQPPEAESPVDTSQVPISKPGGPAPIPSPEQPKLSLRQIETITKWERDRSAKDDNIAGWLMQQGKTSADIQPGQAYSDIVDGANKALGRKYQARVTDPDHPVRVQELKDTLDRKWASQQSSPTPMGPPNP